MAGSQGIKLFKYTQKIYYYIGVIGIDPTESNQMDHSAILTIARKWLFIFSLAQFAFTTTAYFLFEASSMIEYGLSFYSSLSMNTFSYFWRMKNFSNYVQNCERFIEKRTHSTVAYMAATEKIERSTEFFAKGLSLLSLIMYIVFPLIYTVVHFYWLDSGRDSFFVYFPAWFPFDWKTPNGYLVAWLSQSGGLVTVVINAILLFGIVFGSNWLFIAIIQDITGDLVAFNDDNNTARTPNVDRVILLHRFLGILRSYSDAKLCFMDFNDMCRFTLFSFFAWNMLGISSLLVTLQFLLWDADAQLIEIMILSVLALWIIVFNWLICESGQRVTNQFEVFGSEFERCNWNKLPIEMQRFYLIFLSDTQQPKIIRTYSFIACTRDTFKQITTKGFQYFMTLRRFRA